MLALTIGLIGVAAIFLGTLHETKSQLHLAGLLLDQAQFSVGLAKAALSTEDQNKGPSGNQTTGGFQQLSVMSRPNVSYEVGLHSVALLAQAVP